MSLQMVVPPTCEPVDVLSAKRHLRLDLEANDQDELVALLIQTAREMAEHMLGMALISQTLKLRSTLNLSSPPSLPYQYQALPGLLYQRPGQMPLVELALEKVSMDTLQALLSVQLVSVDGVVTSVNLQEVVINAARMRPRLQFKNPVAVYEAEVIYRAGYGDLPSAVPAGIRRWMLFYINTLFEHREAVVVGQMVNPIPNAFIDGLLDPYRIPAGV